MPSNDQLIKDFYEAFQRLDGDAMAACYHPEIRFSDPVFTDLKGAQAGDMWRMLCSRAKDLKIEFGSVQADDSKGSAHWDARYTFSTGRPVHNPIDATFEFQDGKIVRHVDSFDLHAWAAQALGLPGRLLGAFPFFKKKIRASAMKGLDDYRSKTPGN
jgi:ketosteroid isomerase-like protein